MMHSDPVGILRPSEIYNQPSYAQASNAATPPYDAYPENPLCCNESRTGEYRRTMTLRRL